MKLIGSFGPNPRATRFFLLEKGIELPSEEVDLMSGENRQEEYLKKNPGGQVPCLQLDDGRYIGETVAIFEYLEEKHPSPALIGETPEERAETRMWQRRIELNITENIYNGFRYAEGLGLFQERMRCLPDAADGLKAKAQDGLRWLDRLLEGKPFIAGDRFTIADIILHCAVDFGVSVGQPLDPGLSNIVAWNERVASRPAAQASLHPAVEQVGMRG
jgi:glutathione S-transferase